MFVSLLCDVKVNVYETVECRLGSDLRDLSEVANKVKMVLYLFTHSIQGCKTLYKL